MNPKDNSDKKILVAEDILISSYPHKEQILVFLPFISALLVIGTLPPLNFWPLVFIALAPIYIHIYISITTRTSWFKLAWGGFFFGILFSAFLMALTILQFNWIDETYLFSTIVKISIIPLLVLTGICASLSILFSRFASVQISKVFFKYTNSFRHTSSPNSRLINNLQLVNQQNTLKLIFIDAISIFSCASIWTFSEWIIRKMMFSIEYSIVGYPASNTFFTSLASIGGVFLTVFFVTLISMSVGSLALQTFRYTRHRRMREYIASVIPAFAFILVSYLIAYSVHAYKSNILVRSVQTTEQTQNLTISIIQDQQREGEVFGKVKDGVFSFPKLEEHIKEAQTARNINIDTLANSNNTIPDIIIYPFAPWDGVLYDDTKDTDKIDSFNKNIFAVSIATFGTWQRNIMDPRTVFVTWATRYIDGKFYNEIFYWQNGELIGTHQKEKLFPFLDYTPKAAERIGLFTTSIDGTSGTSTLKTQIKGLDIGALVCSEVTYKISESTSRDKDIILSIGSEAFFSNGIAGELNVANAIYRASESGKPVIRANRFGPSAFIDQTGRVQKLIPFGFSGVTTETMKVPIH